MLPERDAKGNYPAFTSIGCYPIIYITAQGDVLCAECASQETDYASDNAVDADVHWEGAPLSCDDCGKDIESAYGDPEDEKEG